MKRSFLSIIIPVCALSICACNDTPAGTTAAELSIVTAAETTETTESTASDQKKLVLQTESAEETTAADTESASSNMDSAECKEFLSRLNEDINTQDIILANMGEYINTYWKNLENVNGTFEEDTAVENAYDWLAKKSDYTKDTVVNGYDDITSAYTEMLQITTDNPVLNDVIDRLKDEYSEYANFYTVVTAPGESRSSFIEKYNSCVNTLNTSYNTISGLLK